MPEKSFCRFLIECAWVKFAKCVGFNFLFCANPFILKLN